MMLVPRLPAGRTARVVVVGVCASGKSELVRRLTTRGLDAHSVAQEHSHVPQLWRHEGRPDVLVYLQASLRVVRRRGRRNLDAPALAEQRRRLSAARRSAHVKVPTDHLTAAEVEALVLREMRAILPSLPMSASPTASARPAIAELEQTARRLRRDIVEMTTTAASGHPSSSMSCIDVMVALYCGGFLRHDPKKPHDPDRDRFILSKGHASPALYAILAERGFFPHDELKTLRRIGSRLEGHPNMRRLPGVEASTGSLGQGLSLGLGHALAARVDGKAYRTYVITGDGEMDEGQIWEALMSAPHLRVDNLTLIVDHNKAQQSNLLERVLDYRPLADKLRSFHWHVEEVDGHDMKAVVETLDKVRQVTGRPQAIVAHTVKGKGVSFVEADWTYHGRPITKEDLPKALAELGGN
ncbi:MAG TPA: transketolase [Chloroflexota bacterium]|nr:transketolase [Chloroflexota bacterium]